jgi:hypothetical protein
MPFGDFFGFVFNSQSGSTDPITAFKAKFNRYPGNNKQWWVAKADVDDEDKGIEAGDFLPELLDKLFAGNNHAPRGHYILNAFYKDRSNASGIVGLPIEVTKQRPVTVCFFAGRAWYGCNSTVYFSQLLTERHKAGLCYQEADPTSEDISDLIATDGGVIPIPEISKIIKLVANGDGVIVIATNGVWNVTGGSGGFTPTDFSVNKISPIGCQCPLSVVETEDSLFWWGDIGIMGMQEKLGMYGPIPGAFERSNITETTIQTFYNEIPEEAKKEVKGVFDARNNRVLWLYRDEDGAATQYNRVLIFDIALSAFYPWKFSELEENSPVVKGAFLSERLNIARGADLVVVDGEQVQAEAVDVETGTEDISRYPSTIEYFTIRGVTARFAQCNNTNFVDWETADGTGATYESFVETGYELFNDAMRRKNITYLFTYLRQTETGWGVDGGGNPELDDTSSCYLTVKWDWANSTVSNKWSTPVQVYRPGRFIGMGVDYDTGFPITITKNKVRGNGKAIQFRYGTDERERNFDIHGWSIAVTGDTVP